MRPKKVCLCVASDIQALSILAFVVQTNGYRTHQAATFEEALTITRNTFFDVLLTHNELDAQSGEQLIKQVKEIRPAARSILMRRASEASVDWSADAQISMPWDAGKLLGALHILAKRKRGPRKQEAGAGQWLVAEGGE